MADEDNETPNVHECWVGCALPNQLTHISMWSIEGARWKDFFSCEGDHQEDDKAVVSVHGLAAIATNASCAP